MEHDSLKEFLSISEKIGKNAESSVGILTTNQKRIECERKALAIVQLLLERSVSVDLFLKSISYLNPSYYEDISEERAILQFCGYPLCRKRISKPKSRYKIVNKSKKVYDLIEYGNFCSIFCFDANNHIKAQILDSPLWLRDLESVPNFSILKKSETYCKSDGINIKSKRVKKTEEFTTISSFAKLSLDDVGDISLSVSAVEEKRDISTEAPKKKSCNHKLATVVENIIEESDERSNLTEMQRPSNLVNEKSEQNFMNTEVIKNQNESDRNEICKDEFEKTNSKMNKPSKPFTNGKSVDKNKIISNERDLKSITDKIKRKVQKSTITLIDPLPLDHKKCDAKEIIEKQAENENYCKNKKSLIELKFSSKDPLSVENSLQAIFNEWISLETLMFIHGDDKIKEILDENKLSIQFEKLRVFNLENDQQQKYVSICRRILEQEVFEEKFEKLLVQNNLKPLPDYKQLKNESQDFDLKVRTFLSGQLHESDDKNFGPVVTNRIENSGEEPIFLPLADKDSQNALRRKILSNTLNKVFEFLLDYINFDCAYVLTDLNNLIRTFNLEADNIVFKPVLRNYIGFICLKILSLKDDKLCRELESKEFVELETSIFEQFSKKREVITSILELIKNVDTFLESYITESDSTVIRS